MNKILKFSILIMTLAFMSCEESVNPNSDAVLMTKSELRKTIGYEWIEGYFNIYSPDSATVEQIKDAFNPETHEFYFFLKPSCACKDLVKEPADILKVLDMAAIPESNYTIYSMGTTASHHPFENELNLTSLPAVYIRSSDQFVYSMIDTFLYYSDIAKFKKVEALILEALSN